MPQKMGYHPERRHMKTLAIDDGMSSKGFEERYDDCVLWAKKAYSGESEDYKLYRAEYQFWKERLRTRHGRFKGIEPRRRSILKTSASSKHKSKRRSSSSTPIAISRSAVVQQDPIPVQALPPNAPSKQDAEKETENWSRMVAERSEQDSKRLAAELGQLPTLKEAQRSVCIPLGTSYEDVNHPAGELFFASENGRPRFSSLCRHRNAESAFIGGKTGRNIKELENEFPRLRFRKYKVKEGLLVWVELPARLKSSSFRLSKIERGLLDLAATLLKTWSGLSGSRLPDIDDFVARYYGGDYDDCN